MTDEGPRDEGAPAEEASARGRMGTGRAVAIGAGVLAGWVALFYAGLTWFRRKAGP